MFKKDVMTIKIITFLFKLHDMALENNAIPRVWALLCSITVIWKLKISEQIQLFFEILRFTNILQ